MRKSNVGLRIRADVLDDGDGVGEHVLVAVDRILLEPHAGSSGRNSSARPVSTRNHSPAAGWSTVDQLVELVADPLGRHDLQAVVHRLHRVDEVRLRLEVVAGDEPGGPQHPQRVVAEADLRAQRRAQAACRRGRPRRRTDRRASGWSVGQLERHGVDREVAARQVGLDGVGERHVRLARVGRVGLGPVGRDLVEPVALLRADRAEALALGPDRVGPPGEQPLDLGRTGVGGGVEVARSPRAHRAAGRGPCRRRGTADARRRRTARPAVRARRARERSALGSPAQATGGGRCRPVTDDRYSRPCSYQNARTASTLAIPGPPVVGGSGAKSTSSIAASVAAVRVAQRVEVVATLEHHEPAPRRQRARGAASVSRP